MTVVIVQFDIAPQTVDGLSMAMTVSSTRRLQSDFLHFIVVSCGLRRGQSDAAHGTQPDIGVLGLWHLQREPALPLLELDQRWMMPPWNIFYIELAIPSQWRVVGPAVGGDGHMTQCWDQYRPVSFNNERACERLDTVYWEVDDCPTPIRRTNHFACSVDLIFHRDIFVRNVQLIAIVGEEVRDQQVTTRVGFAYFLVTQKASDVGHTRAYEGVSILDGACGEQALTEQRDPARRRERGRVVARQMRIIGLVETITVLILDSTGDLRGGPHLSLETEAVPRSRRQGLLDAQRRVSPALAPVRRAECDRAAGAKEVAQ